MLQSSSVPYTLNTSSFEVPELIGRRGMRDESMLLTWMVAWSWLATTMTSGVSFVLFLGDALTVGSDGVVSRAEVVRGVATLGGASRLYASSILFVLQTGPLSAPSDLFAIGCCRSFSVSDVPFLNVAPSFPF